MELCEATLIIDRKTGKITRKKSPLPTEEEILPFILKKLTTQQ